MSKQYKLSVKLDASQALASIANLTKSAATMETTYVNSLTKMEAQLKRVGTVATDLGHNVAKSATDGATNIGNLTGASSRLTAALTANANAAKTVGVSLQTVGRGTTTITTTATKVDKLTTSLRGAQAQSALTAAGLHGVGASVGSMSPHFQQATGHSDGMTTSFRNLLAGGIALSGVKLVVGEIGKALKEAREHAEALGASSLGKRDKARQLASLMGETGPNDRVMGRISGVSLASGMSHDESREFLQEFEGSIPAGIQKGNLLEDQKRDVAKAVARSAIRLGLDPKTAGDMVGTIAKDVDLNKQRGKNGKLMSAPEAAVSQLEATAYGLNEGRGDISVLSRGEIQAAAKAIPSHRIPNRSDIGALVGTASIAGAKSGASAGTFASWWDRGLNRVGDKAGDFLKASGIDKGRDDFEKAHLLRDVLAKEQAASKDPAMFDANKFLAEKGFGSEQDRLALVGMNANIGVLDDRVAKSRAIAADPSIATGKNAAFQNEKSQQWRLAKARTEHAEITQGAKTEDLTIARMSAAASLENEGILNRADQKIADAFKGGFGAAEWAGLKSQQQERIDDRVRQSLEAKVADAGIDTKAGDLRYMKGTTHEGQLRIPDTLKALRDRGIGPLGSSGGMEADAEAMDRNAAARNKWDAARMPLPAPAGPPQARAGGGGGPDPAMEQQNRLLEALVAQGNRPEPPRAMPVNFRGDGGGMVRW